jgi:hypothetical protein
MKTYEIIRCRPDRRATVIKHGLTLEQAKEHCSDESTHKLNKDGSVEWFDAFREESD